MRARLIFVDESGVLMAPVLRRTWSPCGQTPLLHQRTRSHQKVSIIAGLALHPRRSRLNLCFRLHPNRNLTGAEVISFLRCILRAFKGHVVILWDRFNPHRSVATTTFLRTVPRLHPEFFPPYAPELNPTEYFWSYLKNNPLSNFAPADVATLSHKARSAGRSIQRTQSLLRSFVHHSPLPLRI